MNEVKKILTAIGAMAEALGVMREHLMKNGFTRREAVKLCGDYLRSSVGGGKDG